MKSYLGTMVLCLITATAFAQAIGNADNAPRQPGDGAAGPGGAAANGASTGMFAAIDTDGDGVISTKELKNAMKALKALDADKDGNISRAEAAAGAIAAAPAGPVGAGGPAGEVAQAVDTLMKNDKNGDGKLTANELPREMARNIQDADANADGALTRDELMAAAQKMQNQLPGGLAGGLNGPWPAGGANGGRGDSQTGGIFKRYDANGDGMLSPNELPPEMTSALRKADKNGDQMIDPAEMHEFLARMGSGARGFGMGGPNGGQGGVNRPGRNGT